MRNISCGIASCLVLPLWGQAGCASSKPSRFYLLSAESSFEGLKADRDLAVGIGPIEFPKYLDRQQIVTRAAENRLDVAEFDRWAEPLEQNFARVLVDNLSALLSTENVVHYPWKRSPEINCQVIVHVSQFDASRGEAFILHARWTVLDADSHVLAPTRASRISEPMARQDYSSMVQAASRAVDQLSRQIASTVAEIRHRGRPADNP